MSKIETVLPGARPARLGSFWHEFWLKEDWWAVWLGLGIIGMGLVLFAQGASWRWVAVTPPRWTAIEQLAAHFADNGLRYVVQFLLWTAAVSVALAALGHKAREFLPAFALIYLMSVIVFALGQCDRAGYYDLDPPLVALVLGLAISNLIGLPRWLDAGFRVEFYVKISIVLLGATLPFTLILWAGPVAILQASIVSLATFFVIFWVAVRLGLDRRLAATLGAGGAVCGVSAAIAIAAAVGAKKDDAPITITVVILWAIAMIFFLPFAASALHLPAGVGGAWIGTSEFADAAGIAAAQAYGGLVGHDGITGTNDQAIFAFTLMKVVGRDVWIGIWAFVLAIVATTRWEQTGLGRKARAAEIWWRFPKFVIGFLIASLLVTWVTRGYSLTDYNKIVTPALIAPIKDLRSWAFIFCFLSIGLTTRFRDLASAGSRPFLAFSAGVAVNVVLGFILSTLVFGAYWATLGQ